MIKWGPTRWRVIVTFAVLLVLALMGISADPTPTRQICRAELRSWIVAGRGRHLYLDITCPAPYRSLSGRVEFTESRLRSDYLLPIDPAKRNRVAKLNRPHILRPPTFVKNPQDRLEAVVMLSINQVRCLNQDRMFAVRYDLVGPNSNAALKHVMNDCGCSMPEVMSTLGGLLGEFPGIDRDIGPELARDRWPEFGIPTGPQSAPSVQIKPSPPHGGRTLSAP